MTILNIILFVLPLIVGQEFVIVKTVHQINLDVTDATAHIGGSIGLSDSVSVTFTIHNSSGTYVNGVKSSDSTNPSVQNSSGTDTSRVGIGDSVTMQVQNSSGTYTFNGS